MTRTICDICGGSGVKYSVKDNPDVGSTNAVGEIKHVYCGKCKGSGYYDSDEKRLVKVSNVKENAFVEARMDDIREEFWIL